MIETILKDLKSKTSEHNREGMKRFGINTDQALGISVADLRK